MSHADYLHTLIPSKFNDTLSNIEAVIRDKFPECNTVCGTGLSGTMVVPALAAKMGIEWLVVRKGEDNHSFLTVEASTVKDEMDIVFIDDLVETGKTFGTCVAKVFERVSEFNRNIPTRFLGGVVYHDIVYKTFVYDDAGNNYPFYGSRKL